MRLGARAQEELADQRMLFPCPRGTGGPTTLRLPPSRGAGDTRVGQYRLQRLGIPRRRETELADDGARLRVPPGFRARGQGVEQLVQVAGQRREISFGAATAIETGVGAPGSTL